MTMACLQQCQLFNWVKRDSRILSLNPPSHDLSSAKDFRSLPWIWRDYAARGFWTVFGEDWGNRALGTISRPKDIDHLYEPFASAMDKR